MPHDVLVLAGCVLALAVGALGAVLSIRAAPRFLVDDRGITVRSPLGKYLLAWPNVEAVAAASSGSLRVKVRRRNDVLATHVGTEKQRQFLATQEPLQGWDYFYPSADLGAPAGALLERLRASVPAGIEPPRFEPADGSGSAGAQSSGRPGPGR